MTQEHLLIVSNDQQHAVDAAKRLAQAGFRVDVAEDADRALELARKRRYRATVIDQSSADADLYQAIRRRQDSVEGILCVSRPDLYAVEDAIRAGMRHVVSRPVDAVEILPLVEHLKGASHSETRAGLSGEFDDPQEHGSAMIMADSEGPCEVCSLPTRRFHQHLGLYFCSLDCLTRYRYLNRS